MDAAVTLRSCACPCHSDSPDPQKSIHKSRHKSRVAAVIDLRSLRENPDAARDSQRARGEDPGLVDVLLDADAHRRASVSAADNLRAEQKALSKQVSAASLQERPAVLERAKRLAAGVKAAETEQAN